MLQFGTKGYLEAVPWLTIFPGLGLWIVVFSFALVGDALRDVLEALSSRAASGATSGSRPMAS